MASLNCGWDFINLRVFQSGEAFNVRQYNLDLSVVLKLKKGSAGICFAGHSFQSCMSATGCGRKCHSGYRGSTFDYMLKNLFDYEIP